MRPSGPGSKRVAVVTPWYPDAQVPYKGAFVQAKVEAAAPGCDEVSVYHLDGWPVGRGGPVPDEVSALHERALPRSLRAVRTVAEASLYRVPVLVPRVGDWAVHADHHARWLRAALGGRPLEAPVVHAHVGVTAGWAALENAAPDAEVFVTEHASFLPAVLEQPAAREVYGEVLRRCARFFAVGDPIRDQIAELWPEHTGKVDYIANPISFAGRRAEPPARLRRWLSVAALSERKRIDFLIRAFAVCRRDDHELTLTLVGDGGLRKRLEALAAELGVAEAVEFAGAVDPRDIPAIMERHDLLVLSSAKETFGVVVVEALAAGLPVIATRCGGPERVLEGHEDDAGQLIDVEDSPESLVIAYKALDERYPHGLDLERVREVMRRRYSYEAVAEAHHRVWFGEDEGALG